MEVSERISIEQTKGYLTHLIALRLKHEHVLFRDSEDDEVKKSKIGFHAFSSQLSIRSHSQVKMNFRFVYSIKNYIRQSMHTLFREVSYYPMAVSSGFASPTSWSVTLQPLRSIIGQSNGQYCRAFQGLQYVLFHFFWWVDFTRLKSRFDVGHSDRGHGQTVADRFLSF